MTGQKEKSLNVARKGMKEFRGVRWIRWADILLPLAAEWAQEGQKQRAREVYQAMLQLIPAGYERKAAQGRLKAMNQVASRRKP